MITPSQIAALKHHIHIELTDDEFEPQLRTALIQAHNIINAYLDNIEINSELYEVASVELAGYLFDNKGILDDMRIDSILRSCLGFVRPPRVSA